MAAGHCVARASRAWAGSATSAACTCQRQTTNDRYRKRSNRQHAQSALQMASFSCLVRAGQAQAPAVAWRHDSPAGERRPGFGAHKAG